MQQLGDTLNAMMSNEASQKEPQLGLTTTDGRTSIEPRRAPLTESQLTQIASKLLRQAPAICFEKKKKYGRKTVSDDQGTYELDDMVIGEEECVDITFFLNRPLDKKLVESALRNSPPSTVLAHLTRLSLHKRLGSTDQDRQILLHDYADALREFSEFTVFSVCKAFWEDSRSGFYPKIVELREACEAVTAVLKREYNQLQLDAPAPKPKAMREEDSRGGKARRAHLLEFISSKGKELEGVSDLYPSNYSLEGTARGLGWQGYPPDVCPVPFP